ncbi:MAG TPA: SDR family NAD(P)-dependent oxidoreductase [Sporichthyaceae bacterium]|jgi:short-subunit dehydrogenase
MAQPIALVTGGASGIGLAATRRLVQRGFRVAVIDVAKDNLDAVATEFGDAVMTFSTDVADRAALAETVRQIEAIGPIEHALGSAGIARVGATFSVSLADVELMTRVNYFGVVNLVDVVLALMLERGRGEFAVLASATGLVPPKKMAAYGATKAAVINYLVSVDHEHRGKGVTIGIVCPAAVATPMAVDFFADPKKRKKSMATSPEKIVAAIEKGLARKKLIILPGLAKGAAMAERISPALMRKVQSGRLGDLVS